MTPTPRLHLDLKGLKCPLPVLRTRKALKSLTCGDEMVVETTDPLAIIDIAHMCHEDGQTLLDSTATDDGHRFFIRKDR